MSDSELPPGATRAATASVRWTDERHAHVEVHVEMSSDDALVRDLEFAVRNPRPERFRSVGLAIATMVDELDVVARSEAAPAPPNAAPTPESPPAPAAAAPRAAPSLGPPAPSPAAPAALRPRALEPRRGAFEAGAFLGSGAPASARLGPYARVAYDAAPSFYVSAGFASSFRTASSEPSMMWNELLLGGGARTSGSALRVEGGADVALVSTTASATSPLNHTNDRRSLWLPAVALESRLGYPASSPLALTLGVRATWFAKVVNVTNAGESIARVPAYNVGATLGVRLAF